MKKFLILFVILHICISVNLVSANSFNVIIDSKEAYAGDSVTIDVSLENNTGIIAALFKLEYDNTRLKLTGVQDGKLLAGGTFNPDYNKIPYTMVWNSASASNFTDDGVLVSFTFDVLDNAKSGKAYIKLSYNADDVFDVDLNNVSVNVKNGEIDVMKKDDTENLTSNSGGGISLKPTKPSGTSESIETVGNERKETEKTLEFKDIAESDWYYEAVKFAYENHITSGVSKTEFSPDSYVTRGQFITMLCRAYKIPEMTGDNFSDCGNTWYTGYLAAAKQNGISNGVGDNRFAPEKEITREEMVTLIYNYLRGIVSIDGEYAESGFSDNNSISDWAKSAVAFADANGYVSGKNDNIFDPKGNATRAELAQIFFNIFSK